MRRATIKDIAKAAGVHHTTVSRVVNDDPRISEKTRLKISKLIKEMHYVPNSAARSLGRGKTNTIAVVSTSLFNEFHHNVMRGIELEVVKTNYDINIFSTSRFYLVGAKDRESVYSRILFDRLADALIIEHGEMYNDPLLKKYEEAGFPVVNIEGRVQFYGHSVLFDNVKAGEIAGDRLIDTGRKKICLIVGNLNHIQSQRERLAGFEASMKKHGMKIEKNMIIEDIHYSEHFAGIAADEIINSGADSVFCATGDMQAARLMTELERRKKNVPGDIALIGFDDIETAGLIGLTTIRQPLVQMGKRAFEIVKDHMEGKITKQTIEIFKPELIIRKTA